MSSTHEPVTLLREDHLHLTQLFRAFCAAASRDAEHAEKRAVVEQIVLHLQIHLRTLEDVVWPALGPAHVAGIELDKSEVMHELIRTLTTHLSTAQAQSRLFDARAFILMTLTRQALDAEECELFPALRSVLLRRRPADLADSIVRRRHELTTAHELLMGLHELTDVPAGRPERSGGDPTPHASRRPWLLRMMSGS